MDSKMNAWVGVAALLIATFGLLFGENLIGRLSADGVPSAAMNNATSDMYDPGAEAKVDDVPARPMTTQKDAPQHDIPAPEQKGETPAVATPSNFALSVNTQLESATITRGSRDYGYGIALRIRLANPSLTVRPFIASTVNGHHPGSGSTMSGAECRFLNRDGGLIYNNTSNDDVRATLPSAVALSPGEEAIVTIFVECDTRLLEGQRANFTVRLMYWVDDWIDQKPNPWKTITTTFRDVPLQG